MGKTVACVNDLVIRALYTTKKKSRYSYICPTYTQAKDVAWVYLKEAVAGFVTQIRESELRVILPNGAWITLYGSDNQDRLRGLYHDGLICDEFGDCRPTLWGEILLPSLLDRGGWAVFIGTPRGKNHFYQIYERAKTDVGWYDYIMPASKSGILDEASLAEMRNQVSPEEYQQEMECDFSAAVRGTYYAALVNDLEAAGQIKAGACEYDSGQKVNVALDIGYTDSTACWFWQPRPDGLAIIDYYEAQGKALSHYFDMFDQKGYTYETIWLPHDARAKTLQTGRSTVEQFLEKKLPVRITPRLAVQHGIDAVRKVLPRCWIDTNHCYDGVERLRAYRRRYDVINKCYADKPLHDINSNGADAIRYLALVAQIEGKTTATEKVDERRVFTTQQYTLDDLYREREGGKYRYQKLRI